jgi:nucleoside-diphosphate-sugar epimerase
MSLVVVTGASGFAGRRISEALLDAGHEVVALTRKASEFQTRKSKNLSVIELDLSQKITLTVRPEVVVHAAANSNPRASAQMQLRDTVSVAANVIEYTRRAGVEKVIYLSSIAVYGEVSRPVVDEHTPRQNMDLYGTAKYIGELMLDELSTEIPSFSIRLPGLVGGGARGPWLSRLVTTVLKGEPLTIYNAEAFFNNVVHVRDLAGFVLSLVERNVWYGAIAAPIGAMEPISVGCLAELITREAGASSLVSDGGKRGLPFIISSERAIELGYAPRSVKDIVRDYVAEEKSNHSFSVGMGGSPDSGGS